MTLATSLRPLRRTFEHSMGLGRRPLVSRTERHRDLADVARSLQAKMEDPMHSMVSATSQERHKRRPATMEGWMQTVHDFLAGQQAIGESLAMLIDTLRLSAGPP